MLADHIVEASTGRLKQEVIEAEIESRKVGISSDVRLLSGYLGEVERWGWHICISYCIAFLFFLTNNHSQSYYTLKVIFLFLRFLNSKPQTPSPKPNSLSGPEDQQSPQAKQAPSSPSEWTSFLCAAMKEERLKTDSSCLAMTEAEQGELYETIRHALHSLRKHKASVT